MRAAPNSQGRGCKHPDGRLVADLPSGGPAALLMQTVRGEDPRTPRGQEAHLCLEAGPLPSPSGYVAPVLPPAGGQTLVCPTALWLPTRALALCCPAAGCRLPAGSRDPAVVTGFPYPSPGVPCPSCMAVASGSCSACRVAYPAACSLTNSQGRDPRTSEVLRWALPCVRVAPNSQGWGPENPMRPVCPPISWDLVPYLAHRAIFPLFCFRPPLPCSWAAAMACSGMGLQGLTTPVRAVRTSCATDRGKAACW